MSSDDLYRRNPARDVEQFALAIVKSWVGNRGTVRDTSTGHEPDFQIIYQDGRIGWGEVGWHEDPVIRAMWSKTFRYEQHQVVQLPNTYGTWTVQLVAGANIGRFCASAPALIGDLIGASVFELTIHGGWPRDALAHRARTLGIERVSRLDNQQHEGAAAYFFMPSTGGVFPTDPNGVPEWVSMVLADPAYQDTTRKLLVLEADERHVFLMTGTATAFGIDALLNRARSALPAARPEVPDGITHVWAAPQYSDSLPGTVLLWTSGHWRTVDVPDDGV